jgi:hypothetical protein
MKYRTEIDLTKFNFNIDYNQPLVLMGSCFSDHMGKSLLTYKFDALSNPLGISFNPISVARQLNYCLDPSLLKREDWAFHDGLWHHFDFHGRFSGKDREKVHQTLEKALVICADYLSRSRALFITFGTANVYFHREKKMVVANNHKFPIADFSKARLTQDEIVQAFEPIIPRLKSLNPQLRIVFTVSPVRYTRDGLVENQRSKASLLLAVEQLCRDFDQHYFPSYEMFIDDLRDYRYYEKEMIHPGEQGVQYVWENFTRVFFSAKTEEMRKQVEGLVLSSKHRPIHPKSENHYNFLCKIKDKITAFQKEHPEIDLQKELASIEEQVTNF